MDKLVVVTVVRDLAMYHRLVSGNPNLAGAVFAPEDNRAVNENITVRYNHFLDTYDYSQPAWFMFCHEDFEVMESLSVLLAQADKHTVYGPVGVLTRIRFDVYCQWCIQGLIEECDRTGVKPIPIGQSVPMGTRVETLDCQCLIVHSSLIAKTNMRFDGQLTFDLYVEDFCIQAYEHFGVISCILPFKCRHWSHGHVQTRYFEQEHYLNAKWSTVCYTGTSSYEIGGGAGWRRKINDWLKRLVRHL